MSRHPLVVAQQWLKWSYDSREQKHKCTHQILDVSIDIFLHAAGPSRNPAAEWAELYGVRLMTGAVTFLR